MKQIVIKGDDYELEGDYNDTYNDPAKKIKPPSGVYDPLIAITKTETPSTGSFVFCNGKAVVLQGEVFSKLKADIYRREWPEEGEDSGGAGGAGKSKGGNDYKDEKKSTENLDITASGSSSMVFVGGVPVCYKEEGVNADQITVVIKDGEKQESSSPKTKGKFIKNNAKVYMQS